MKWASSPGPKKTKRRTVLPEGVACPVLPAKVLIFWLLRAGSQSWKTIACARSETEFSHLCIKTMTPGMVILASDFIGNLCYNLRSGSIFVSLERMYENRSNWAWSQVIFVNKMKLSSHLRRRSFIELRQAFRSSTNVCWTRSRLVGAFISHISPWSKPFPWKIICRNSFRGIFCTPS